jgi:hypothetical protein
MPMSDNLLREMIEAIEPSADPFGHVGIASPHVLVLLWRHPLRGRPAERPRRMGSGLSDNVEIRGATMNAPVCGGGVSWLGCNAELHWEPEWDRDPAVAIRCLDCHAVLCPSCARRHFEGDEKDKRIATLDAALDAKHAKCVELADKLRALRTASDALAVSVLSFFAAPNSEAEFVAMGDVDRRLDRYRDLRTLDLASPWCPTLVEALEEDSR